MLLLIDNFDSFTYNLVDYFHQLGQSVDVIKNDIPPDSIDFKHYKGIVFSPGPETPSKSNFLLNYIASSSSLPQLGICLGHQAIGQYYGSKLLRLDSPWHGKVSKITHNGSKLFQDLPSEFDVVRYHSWVITEVEEPLTVTSRSKEGEVMSFQHSQKPITGIQFHPESVLTKHGLALLGNWLKMNGI